jgi:hypothetical protein
VLVVTQNEVDFVEVILLQVLQFQNSEWNGLLLCGCTLKELHLANLAKSILHLASVIGSCRTLEAVSRWWKGEMGTLLYWGTYEKLASLIVSKVSVF